MKIKTVSVNVGRTISFGEKFEFARIDYGATAELGPDDKPGPVRTRLQSMLLTALNAEVEALQNPPEPVKRGKRK